MAAAKDLELQVTINAPRSQEVTLPVIYVAGPFTAPTAWDIAQNVREAEFWGLEIARQGAMPLIPHANTSLFHGQCDEAFWYAGTLELMRRCDGVFVYRTHHIHGKAGKSVGVEAEMQEAARLKLPLYTPSGITPQEWLVATFGDRLHVTSDGDTRPRGRRYA